MSSTAKPRPHATLCEALIYVALPRVMWPAFLALAARHSAAKTWFYWLCWSNG